MQSYAKNLNTEHIRTVSGYAWLILVLNQGEVGARLGLSPAYAKHIPMFREYLELQRLGRKKAYIYAVLGEKYGMHPSSVKRVVFKLLATVHV